MLANLTRDQEKKGLIALLAILAVLVAYRLVTDKQPKTAPLAYPPGTVAHSAVRQGLIAGGVRNDPLNVFIARREEKFPGVARNIFKMENPAPKPKYVPVPLPVVTAPVFTIPEKTPEELAEEAARADLSKFRFLGYLTEKDNTLFLSKEGELFIVKTGDKLLGSYTVKEASKDYVVLFDTVTHAEARIELAGGESAQPQSRSLPQRQPQRQQMHIPHYPLPSR